jgi:hypothetical protein
MLLLLKLRNELFECDVLATLIVAETNTVNKASFVAEADVKDSEYSQRR